LWIFVLQTWSEKINRAHAEAKKDNDFIYNDQEPRPDALQPIGRAALAKSVPLGPTPVTSGFKDIFEKLVPTAVHQALQAFESRQAEITNIEVSRSRAATQELKGYIMVH
jgi:programmed cell death 6-interacting protein